MRQSALFPEEPVMYCRNCRLPIPYTHCWRRNGRMVTARGDRKPTLLLHTACPKCGRRDSVGLDGNPLYRLLYRWLWQLRYPATEPPPLPAYRLADEEEEPPVQHSHRA